MKTLDYIETYEDLRDEMFKDDDLATGSLLRKSIEITIDRIREKCKGELLCALKHFPELISLVRSIGLIDEKNMISNVFAEDSEYLDRKMQLIYRCYSEGVFDKIQSQMLKSGVDDYQIQLLEELSQVIRGANLEWRIQNWNQQVKAYENCKKNRKHNSMKIEEMLDVAKGFRMSSRENIGIIKDIYVSLDKLINYRH